MVLSADPRPGDALDAQNGNANRTLRVALDTALVTHRITLARPGGEHDDFRRHHFDAASWFRCGFGLPGPASGSGLSAVTIIQ